MLQVVATTDDFWDRDSSNNQNASKKILPWWLHCSDVTAMSIFANLVYREAHSDCHGYAGCKLLLMVNSPITGFISCIVNLFYLLMSWFIWWNNPIVLSWIFLFFLNVTFIFYERLWCRSHVVWRCGYLELIFCACFFLWLKLSLF